ncbi:short-chain dehydrogenase [Erwinia typographi]|uniref:Short-chain dehydrogenase n=1 Tax=Erwinia typographi TaxID=371042 RepID=A0A0A4A8D8_9GAMM|nr:SDR family NAD(P)-dependent oxidoreductase [Erwinia typographi]KGT94113.1 short-chain dehydrogenase [Erwinia typographi]
MREKKIWFITGASRGFGRLWCEAALQRGDKVVATARDIATLNVLVKSYGNLVLPLQLDVTDRQAVLDTMNQAHAHFDRIDVVLNAAGYGYMGAVEEIEFEEAKANFETNFFGGLSVIQAAIPLMRKQKSGHILTVSSIGGVLSFPTGGIYTATKFAVEALTEALAGEVAGLGIKVTIIEPGSFATGFGASTKSAPGMEIYDPVRNAIRGSFKPSDIGEPSATTAAIMSLVDANAPPLRLILGATTLPKFTAAYESRLAEWNAWKEVSIAAHGNVPN